jgi:hypothetical protein
MQNLSYVSRCAPLFEMCNIFIMLPIDSMQLILSIRCAALDLEMLCPRQCRCSLYRVIKARIDTHTHTHTHTHTNKQTNKQTNKDCQILAVLVVQVAAVYLMVFYEVIVERLMTGERLEGKCRW